jgi:hypothetical protein
MAAKDFWSFEWDFFGHEVFSTTAADNATFRIADTSSAGTPTYAVVDGSATGEIAIDFDATSEAQNVCLYQSDILQYDIDLITEVEWRVKMNQATADSATSLAFGVTGDRNDAIDSIAQAALFRVIGADSTTAVVVETDDTTSNEKNDIATGKTLINAYKDFKISFAVGTDDVRFFIDGDPVATGTTFDMSGYTGSLQLFLQLQKTADTNTDGVTVDRIAIRGRRATNA